jgi:hypothetical protein
MSFILFLLVWVIFLFYLLCISRTNLIVFMMMHVLPRGVCNMALLGLFLQGMLLQSILLQGLWFPRIRAKRIAKSWPTRAIDEAVPSVASRKQSVASDDQGHSGPSQLEPSLARVNVSLFGDSHNVISKALKTYDRLVLKESRNIHANQQKNKEAQHQIKKS